MNRTYARTVTLLLIVLAACSDSGGSDFSEAYCTDLRAGLTVMNLRSAADQYTGDDLDPEQYAGLVKVWVTESCPSQLTENAGVKALMEGWGLDE